MERERGGGAFKGGEVGYLLMHSTQTYKSEQQPIALKALMIMPALLLQKPSLILFKIGFFGASHR